MAGWPCEGENWILVGKQRHEHADNEQGNHGNPYTVESANQECKAEYENHFHDISLSVSGDLPAFQQHLADFLINAGVG